jgi:hypothetical protein
MCSSAIDQNESRFIHNSVATSIQLFQPSSFNSKVPSPAQHDPYYSQVQVTPPRESPILGWQLVSTKPFPTDRKDLTQGSSLGILEESTKADKENLSPCSKLALEWSERKTLGQNNRKRHNKLKPFSANNHITEQNQTIFSQSQHSHLLSPLDIEPFLDISVLDLGSS